MEEKNRRDALLAAVRFGRAAHAARLALATPPRPAPAAAPSRAPAPSAPVRADHLAAFRWAHSIRNKPPDTPTRRAPDPPAKRPSILPPRAPPRANHHGAAGRAPAQPAGVPFSAALDKRIKEREIKAAKILPFVPLDNQIRALGLTEDEYISESAESPGCVQRRFATMLAENKGDLDSARTTLVRLIAFLKLKKVIAVNSATIPSHTPQGEPIFIADYHLDAFLNGSGAHSTASRKRRRVALQLLRDSMSFRLSLGRISNRKIYKPRKRAGVSKPPPYTAGPDVVAHLDLLASDNTLPLVISGSAAMALGCTYSCLRWAGAQRAGNLRIQGDFLRGDAGADFKKQDPDTMFNRPFLAVAKGLMGTDAWASRLVRALADMPYSGEDVEADMFLVRDNDSPNGDPRHASKFLDRRMGDSTRPTRGLKMLRGLLLVPALYQDGRHAFPVEGHPAALLTFKHLRRFFPALAAAAGERGSAINEIGSWSGSQSEKVRGDTLDEAARGATACSDLYSMEGTVASAPYIMMRVMRMANRALGPALASRACPNGLSALAKMRVQGSIPAPGARPAVLARAAPTAPPAAGATSRKRLPAP